MRKERETSFKRGARGLLAALLLVLSLAWSSPRQQTEPAANFQAPKNEVVFVSDTQAPMFFEKLRLLVDRNEEATAKILDQISLEPNLAAVFMLGDVTSSASTDDKWRHIDDFLQRMRKGGVPVYAAMGNHDYFWSAQKGLSNCRQRFPELASTWYSISLGPLSVIILNSNFGKLTMAEQANQIAFYNKALAQAEADPGIKGVIVCCHHAPYTNGRINEPSAKAQADFVPPFLKSRKCLLFLSGHAHAAEHFVHEGKPFLVLGGGGGLLHPLFIGPGRKYEDLFPSHAEKRFYHFLKVRIGEAGLVVNFEVLKRDLSGFTSVDQFSIDW
jgi:predicted MPP superfamily phosphohydrolase